MTVYTRILNLLRTFGLPNYNIKLKVGAPIMLLRNLDQSQGLCNESRLIVTKLAKHVISGKIITAKKRNKNLHSTFIHVTIIVPLAIQVD